MARRRKPVTLFDVIHRGNPVAYTPKPATPPERKRSRSDGSAEMPIIARDGLRRRVALWLLGSPVVRDASIVIRDDSAGRTGADARVNPPHPKGTVHPHGPANDAFDASDPTAGDDPIRRAMRIMEARRAGRADSSASDSTASDSEPRSNDPSQSPSDANHRTVNGANATDSIAPKSSAPQDRLSSASASSDTGAQPREISRSASAFNDGTRRPALSAMERLRNELRASGSSASAVYFESSRDVDLDAEDRSTERDLARQGRGVNGPVKAESRPSKKSTVQRNDDHATSDDRGTTRDDRRSQRESNGPGWIETAIAGFRYRWSMRMRAVGAAIRTVVHSARRLVSGLAFKTGQTAGGEQNLDRGSVECPSTSNDRAAATVASVPTMRWSVLAIPLAGLFVFSFGLGRVMLRAGGESGGSRPDVLDIAGPIDAGVPAHAASVMAAAGRSAGRPSDPVSSSSISQAGSGGGIANVASAPVQAEVQRNPGAVPARVGGVNYVIVQSYPDEMTAQSVADLLTSRGIAATVEKNLPRWSRPGATLYSVVGLDAFERMSNNPQYARYVDRIRKLSDEEFNKGLNKRLDPHAYRWPQ
jgi:hypothetical protein